MPDEKRIVKRKEGEGWAIIPFEDLRKGDIFMLYEPDGEGPIPNTSGEVELHCTKDAFRGPYGPDGSEVWTVEVEDPDSNG